MDSSRPKKAGQPKRQACDILAEHEKPIIIDTGGIGMFQYKVVSPPGIGEVSGVPYEIAPTARGKLLAAPILCCQTEHFLRAERMLRILKSVPDNARIYCETTGTGHQFYRVKFRQKDPVSPAGVLLPNE